MGYFYEVFCSPKDWAKVLIFPIASHTTTINRRFRLRFPAMFVLALVRDSWISLSNTYTYIHRVEFLSGYSDQKFIRKVSITIHVETWFMSLRLLFSGNDIVLHSKPAITECSWGCHVINQACYVKYLSHSGTWKCHKVTWKAAEIKRKQIVYFNNVLSRGCSSGYKFGARVALMRFRAHKLLVFVLF